MSLLRILPCELLMTHLYPTLYELHSMSPDVGLPQTEDGGGGGGAAVAGIRMPPAAVNLSSERLVRHGIYLMDCLDRLYLFIGRSVHPQVIQELFGKQSVDQLVAGKFTLPIHSDPGPSQLNRRVNAIIGKLRENPQRRFLYPDLFLVKEDGGDALLRMLFLSALIEDRQDIGPSLPQFLNEIRERVQKTNV